MIREHDLVPGGMVTATDYAGFWKRFAVIFIDLIILGIVGGVMTGVFGQHLGGSLNALIGWLYFAGMESSERQATIGTMASASVSRMRAWSTSRSRGPRSATSPRSSRQSP